MAAISLIHDLEYGSIGLLQGVRSDGEARIPTSHMGVERDEGDGRGGLIKGDDLRERPTKYQVQMCSELVCPLRKLGVTCLGRHEGSGLQVRDN